MNNKYRTIMMNRRFFFLLLMGVVMTVSASAQGQGGKGYWTLALSKTFIEGERSNGENTGIIGGQDGLAEFRIFHFVPATFKPDGSYTVENRPDVTVINMGGQKTQEQRNIYRLSVMWSRPPQYVKITEEGKIALDVNATIDGSPYTTDVLKKNQLQGLLESYDIEMELGIMPEVRVGKFTMGFNLMQQLLNACDSSDELPGIMEGAMQEAGISEDDLEEAMEKAVGSEENELSWSSSLRDVASGKLYNDEEWAYNLKLGDDAYMMITVTTTFHDKSAFKPTAYSITQYYLYRYGGDDVDVTIRGDDKDQWQKTEEETDSVSKGGDDNQGGGENKGTDLPPWVIPVTVGTIGVVGGFTLLRVLRKKDEEIPPTPPSTDKPNGQQTTPGQEPLTPQEGVVPPPPPTTTPSSPTTPPLPPPPPSTKKGKDGKDDKKERENSTYRMILYKEFGDTLMVGDEPKLVGARIEEITAKGEKYDRQDLTAQIQIAEGENITITETGRSGIYRAAYIKVEHFPKKEPLEGEVWFIFQAPGGSLRNRVVFNIVDGEVRFQQDNLTLPARYEKEVRLPFVVVGMNDGTAKIEATIKDEHNKDTQDYSLKTEWCEKDKCYYAIIKDQITDPKKDEGIAGNYLGYTLHIEASKETPKKRVIKGELPINRYYMGLVMRMNGNVHCFHEEYRPGYHDPELKVRKSDGKDYAPAQQECYLKLYEYDEEEHRLYIIDPKPLSVKWTVTDIAKRGGVQGLMMDLLGNEYTQMNLNAALAGAGLGAGIGTAISNAHLQVFKDIKAEQQRNLQFQKMLNDLGLQFKAQWQTAGDGKIYYLLRCSKGILVAPNRFDAEMEITAEYDKKTYTFKRVVHILSQPRRTYDDNFTERAALEKDEQIEKGLHEIEGGLMAAGLTGQMAPLLYTIRLQLDFYDFEYGYDPHIIKSIQNCYLNSLRRLSDEAKEKVAAMDAVDKLEKFSIDWWLEWSYQGHDLLENMNWAERVAFAVASFGYSELVFNIPYEMRQRIIDNKEDKDALRTWADAFCVGAWEAGKTYLIEQGVNLGIGTFKVLGKTAIQGAKTTGKGLITAAKTVGKESLQAGGKVAKEAMIDGLKSMKEFMKSEVSTGLKTWTKKQFTLWEKGAAERFIGNKLKSWFPTKDVMSGAELSAAEQFAKRQAVENIENLQTVLEMYKGNPTSQNKLLLNQYILKCQADKQTMMLLKTPRLLGDDKLLQGLSLKPLKQEFNSLLQKIYSETDDLVKADLAKATNGQVPFDKIQVLNASGSKGDLLKKGLDITFDRDITYYWTEIVDGVEKKHYFNQTYVEKLYARHFRNVVNQKILPPNTLGFDPRALTPEAIKKLETQEAKQAALAAKLYDQTVIEDVFRHLESYGDDLERMIDPELHAFALQHPEKVAEAIFYKGNERFTYAAELWTQAESHSGWEKEFLQGRSVSEMMEGCRQLRKIFGLLKDRDAQRHLFTKIPGDVKKAIKIIENLDGVQVKLSEAQARLAEIGYDFTKLAQEVSELVYKIG